MTDINDALAALNSDEDQAKAHTKALTERLGLFRKTLLLEGFSAEQADSMSYDLFGAIVRVSFGEAMIDMTNMAGEAEDDDDR